MVKVEIILSLIVLQNREDMDGKEWTIYRQLEMPSIVQPGLSIDFCGVDAAPIIRGFTIDHMEWDATRNILFLWGDPRLLMTKEEEGGSLVIYLNDDKFSFGSPKNLSDALESDGWTIDYREA